MLSLRLPWIERRRIPRGPRPGTAQVPVPAVDAALLWVVAALMLLGLVMVYSSSIALPDSPRYAAYQPTHFLVRHAISLAVAVILGLILFAVPMRRWQLLSPWLFLLGIVLLVVVLIPGVGRTVLGARRWLSLFVFNLQPSELMKLFAVLYVADYTVRKQEYMQFFRKGFLPMGAAVSVIGMLLLLEPDLGAFVVISAIAMGLLFIGGVNGRLFAGLVITALGTFATIIWASSWRSARIFAYLNPFAPENALSKGYQLSHALIALGRGQITGVGLGGSVEKLHYLPEAHTDFLLAVIGEELGLVGVLVLIAAFFWLTRRAFLIGRQAITLERSYAGLVAKGVGLWIGLQAFINIGVNLGLLPTKGLTLPLMSFGGTGLVVNCIGIALLMRVDFENRRLMRGAA
jgi:cell division protein FtsW